MAEQQILAQLAQLAEDNRVLAARLLASEQQQAAAAQVFKRFERGQRQMCVRGNYNQSDQGDGSELIIQGLGLTKFLH